MEADIKVSDDLYNIYRFLEYCKKWFLGSLNFYPTNDTGLQRLYYYGVLRIPPSSCMQFNIWTVKFNLI